MEEVQLYAVTLSIIIGILLALRLQQWIASYTGLILHLVFLRYFRYRMVFTARNWLQLTWLEFLIFMIYLAGNVVSLSLSYSGIRDLEQRLAIIAITNCTLLFFSGQTNLIAEWLGISFGIHASIHRWIGRIVALEAIIHTIIVLILRPIPGKIVTSGYLTAGAVLFCILFVNPSTKTILRIIGGLIIPKFVRVLPIPDLHTIFSLTFLTGLFWHIISLPSPSEITKISILLCSLLWIFSTILRFARVLLWGLSAKVVSITSVQDYICIRINTKHPIKIVPGAYIYAYSRRSLVFTNVSGGNPLMIVPESKDSEWTTKGVINFSFALPNDPNLVSQFKKGKTIIIDGPYGINPRLETYENLFIAAEGMGIIGALNTALFITARKQSDKLRNGENMEKRQLGAIPSKRPIRPKKLYRDLTRRIDLYWAMESNEQEGLVAEYIENLQKLDQDNPIVYICCFYPDKKDIVKRPLIIPSDFLHCYYNIKKTTNSVIKRLEDGETFMSSGDAHVISYGSQWFIDVINQSTIKLLKEGYLVKISETNVGALKNHNKLDL